MTAADIWTVTQRCRLCPAQVEGRHPDLAIAGTLAQAAAQAEGFVALASPRGEPDRLRVVCKACAAEVTVAYLNAGRARQVEPDRGTLMVALASAGSARYQAQLAVQAAKTPADLEAARAHAAVTEAEERAARAALDACEAKLAAFQGPTPP